VVILDAPFADERGLFLVVAERDVDVGQDRHHASWDAMVSLML
jgi:hypothetical protein